MDVEKVNLLKDKGNKAYVNGKYNEALDLYKEALDSAGSGDTNIAAILHSNISQAYLKKKEYSHAIESATESLELDPSFMKSNLRRAAANVELDNLADAMNDLRLIFSNEPKNIAAKDLMKRCSDKPKMKFELHEVYAKHYLRPVIKKSGAQDMGRRNQINSPVFQNALLRQTLLSMRGLDISNDFFCENFIGFQPGQRAFICFYGWILRQFMCLNYAYSSISVVLSGKLFNLIYRLFRQGTFSLTIACPFSLMDKPSLLDKYSEIFLAKEAMLTFVPADESDLKLMKHYSEDITRLVYIPGLANFKHNKFPKAKTMVFDPKHPISSDVLKLWKKNNWPVKSLSFIHGVLDLKVLKQFNGIISSDVKSVFIQFADQNQKFNNVIYEKLCNNLATLKGVFSGLTEVTITQFYGLKVQSFPQFAQNLALMFEAYETISTKPEWSSKLKVVVFVEFVPESRTESKIFDVKLLEQSVGSLRRKHPDMKMRFCGPRCYDGFWSVTPCVHAVVEFENKVAHFELAICYNYLF